MAQSKLRTWPPSDVRNDSGVEFDEELWAMSGTDEKYHIDYRVNGIIRM